VPNTTENYNMQFREFVSLKFGNQRYECTIQRPIIIFCLSKYFDAKKILDPCIGWGSRLIGALAANCDEYVGCDPNTKLFNGYNKIKNMFDHNNIAKLHNIPFEDFEHQENYFDMTFTSPPYCDFEIYSNEETQSSERYQNEENWTNSFLIPMLAKSILYTKKNGIIAINIGEIFEHSYISKMLKYMDYQNVKYLGIIPFMNVKNDVGKPIFIWKKL